MEESIKLSTCEINKWSHFTFATTSIFQLHCYAKSKQVISISLFLIQRLSCKISLPLLLSSLSMEHLHIAFLIFILPELEFHPQIWEIFSQNFFKYFCSDLMSFSSPFGLAIAWILELIFFFLFEYSWHSVTFISRLQHSDSTSSIHYFMLPQV